MRDWGEIASAKGCAALGAVNTGAKPPMFHSLCRLAQKQAQELNNYTMPPKKGPRNKAKTPRPRFSVDHGAGQGGLGGPEVPEEEAAGDADERDDAHERHGRGCGHRIQSVASALDDADADTDGSSPDESTGQLVLEKCLVT